MESKIKWKTGEPYESGYYLVTMKDGITLILDASIGIAEQMPKLLLGVN